MARRFFVLSLSFFLLGFSAQAFQDCSVLFSNVESQPKWNSFEKINNKWSKWKSFLKKRAEWKSFQKNLKSAEAVGLPTVFFSELQSDGFVRLRKESATSWWSTYDHLRRLTPQSDPRSPIFLFGAELAFGMGFRIGKSTDGSIYMLAPGAERLKNWIREMNRILKSKGYEPISYTLEKSEFVSPSGALQMMTKKDSDNDILLRFPYSDKNPKLTVHEISFHLGAILFPRKFIQRGHDINMRTKQFIEYLESRRAELGSVTDRIIAQILSNRGYENDAGTAEVTAGFAYLREINDFASHAELAETLIKKTSFDEFPEKFFISRAIDFYARPQMSPLAAVVYGLHRMTGIEVSNLGIFPKNNSWKFNIAKLIAHGIHIEVYLSLEEKNKFQEIVKGFVDLHKNEEAQSNYELSTPEEWVLPLGKGLDLRIQQLLEAAAELSE